MHQSSTRHPIKLMSAFTARKVILGNQRAVVAFTMNYVATRAQPCRTRHKQIGPDASFRLLK